MTNSRAFQKTSRVLVVAVLALLVFAAAPAMAEFGLQRFAISARNQDGTPDVQAGSHPYALTTTFVLNQPPCTKGRAGALMCIPEGNLKDARLELPPGFVGNPDATPRCTYQEFIKGDNGFQIPGCSNEATVGAATAYVGESVAPREGFEYEGISEPVFNLVPPPGVAAEFGFIVAGQTPVLLQTSVRTGVDYGLTTSASDTNQAVLVTASKVTIWGVPASPAHNRIRGACVAKHTKVNHPLEEPGWGLREGEDELEGPIGPYTVGAEGFPLEAEKGTEAKGGCPTQAPLLPLLTNPTSCGVPRMATLSVDSWKEPGNFSGSRTKQASLPPLSGCEKLDFSPTLTVKPDGEAGSTPTGLNVALHVPQETTENPVGLAEADVRDTTIALPAGVQLSPSAADGLQACPQLHGEEPAKEAQEENHELSGINLGTKQPANCPDASKVANVRIKSPLLEKELTGSMYLAAPQNFAGLPENPFSSKVALYLVAEEHERGVLIKLAGKVTPAEGTGQLTTTFEDTPQLPFSELKAEFFGTARAPLATPALCASYTTTATFTPWSATPAVSPTSSFNVTSGPELQTPSGPLLTPCPGASLPFSPSLDALVTDPKAGEFSPFSTTLSREDGNQDLGSVQLHMPPGLSGMLKGVPLCPEAQANAGTCGPESLIGETIVSVGLGNDPFSVTGGKVYLTEKYAGAPFGLSIVNPAKAGPFDLQEGRPVIVRAKIEIDPRTAALTVTTGQLPTIIEGFPLQIKHVNVTINRPGFMFNPTSCSAMAVTGSIASAEGASAPVSDHFEVTNCAALKFTPDFKVATSGKPTKANGTSLTARIVYPVTPESSGKATNEANIGYVKVELPEQLPSRLTTLQKACLAKVFEEDRSKCDPASIVGHAVVHTPLLPVPLEGPAYFVSHGNEEFPNLTMILQGYGVTVELVGTTFISKAGVTSTTFKSPPDVPFNTFELNLPPGKFSALAAPSGSLPVRAEDADDVPRPERR